MNSLDNLKERIDNELSSLSLSEEDIRRMTEKVHSAPGSRFPGMRLAAAAAVLLIIFAAAVAGRDQIVTAVSPILKMIPGINEVVVDSQDIPTWVLKNPVSTEDLQTGSKVTVVACYARQDQVVMHVRDNCLEQMWRESVGTVLLQDSSGQSYLPGHYGGGYSFGYDNYFHEIRFATNRAESDYTLVINDMKIPLHLEKADSPEDMANTGLVSSRDGVTIVAMPSREGNLLALDLVAWTDDQRRLEVMGGDIHLVDESGQSYMPELEGSDCNMNHFVFNVADGHGLKLEIPSVILTADEKYDINLSFPGGRLTGPVDIPFNNGSYGIKVIDVSRQPMDSAGNLMASSDPGALQGLQLIIDKNSMPDDGDVIDDFIFICDSRYLLEPNAGADACIGIPETYGDLEAYSSDRYKIIRLPYFPQSQENLLLNISDPIYVVRGGWEIDLGSAPNH